MNFFKLGDWGSSPTKIENHIDSDLVVVMTTTVLATIQKSKFIRNNAFSPKRENVLILVLPKNLFNSYLIQL